MATTYWNETGRYQAAAKALDAMIPMTGSVDQPRKNKKLEKYRRAVNCYYDLYNNGLCNRRGEFARVIGVTPSHYRIWRSGDFHPGFFSAVESAMDVIIRDAAVEQGLDHLLNAADLTALNAMVAKLTDALRAAHNALDVAQSCMDSGRDQEYVLAAFVKTRDALAG